MSETGMDLDDLIPGLTAAREKYAQVEKILNGSGVNSATQQELLNFASFQLMGNMFQSLTDSFSLKPKKVVEGLFFSNPIEETKKYEEEIPSRLSKEDIDKMEAPEELQQQFKEIIRRDFSSSNATRLVCGGVLIGFAIADDMQIMVYDFRSQTGRYIYSFNFYIEEIHDFGDAKHLLLRFEDYVILVDWTLNPEGAISSEEMWKHWVEDSEGENDEEKHEDKEGSEGENDEDAVDEHEDSESEEDENDEDAVDEHEDSESGEEDESAMERFVLGEEAHLDLIRMEVTETEVISYCEGKRFVVAKAKILEQL